MEDQVWWTRKARINAEKRLLENQKKIDYLLLWYSLSAVFVSIWQIYSPADSNQPFSSMIFTCFSVFILALSLLNGNCKFSGRAAQFKDNYIALQRLYYKIKESNSLENQNHQEYEKLLNVSENHEEIDYLRSLIWEWINTTDKSKLTRLPQKHHFIIYSFYKIKRYILLLFLFLLPIVLIAISFQ